MCAVPTKKADAAGGGKQNQKICCFCEQWESGGIESFLANAYAHMDLTQMQIDIVAARLGSSIFTKPLEQAGVVFYELAGSTRSLIRNWQLFQKLLREKEYDVVHLNIFHGLSLLYALLAKKEGVAVRIVHSHNTALRRSRSRLFKLAVHRTACLLLADTATHRWACSGQAARFLFPGRILKKTGFTFIPNGIDTGRFIRDEAIRRQMRARMHLEGRLVIGNVGRLCYQKNQKFLLEVLAAVQKRIPQSTLLFIGEGEDRGLLERLAARAGLSDAVLFWGTTDHVERMYQAMDVFAFPSLFEGLGIAALEAQASGLVTLCSEHVPQEAFVTALARRISLKRGAGCWADAVLAAAEEGGFFKGYAVEQYRQGTAVSAAACEQLRQAGFDCAGAAEKIQCAYTRAVRMRNRSGGKQI